MLASFVQGPCLGQASLCEPILRALPEWFGIEKATRQYLKDIDLFPTFLAWRNDRAVGFLTLKAHNAYAAEIHVMGVLPEMRRHGIGRALIATVEKHLQGRGVEYLQVKTLSSRHPDEGYAQTRAFYEAVGFRPLEEFPDLWGEANPCLQMVKCLK